MRRALAVGWAVAALAAGCEQPRTELVVRVDSEVAWGAGQTVQSVVVTVRRGSSTGTLRSARTTTLGAGGDRRALPLLVGVVESDGDTGTPVWVEALGCGDANGCTAAEARVAQRAVVRFAKGQTQELTLLLASACVGATCTSEQRCATTSGMCEAATAAQATVRPYEPGDAASVADVAAMVDVVGALEAGSDVTDAADAGDVPDDRSDVAADGGTDGGGDTGAAADAGIDVGDMEDVGEDASTLRDATGLDTPDVNDVLTVVDLGPPVDRPSTVDAALPPVDDGSVACPSGQTRCSGACVDLRTDADHCGACGSVCAAGSLCNAGSCTAPTCTSSASDCNGSTADGCEVVHATALDTCAAPEELGAYCGDTSCGSLCPATTQRVVATRTGNRARWFRARLNDCSSCPATLNGRVRLSVPAEVDYDLFVYSACGVLIGQSQAPAGMSESVVLSRSSTSSNESIDVLIEVRWYTGASCMPWTLTLEARSDSATSC